MSTIQQVPIAPVAEPVPGSSDDPFRYGWRDPEEAPAGRDR